MNGVVVGWHWQSSPLARAQEYRNGSIESKRHAINEFHDVGDGHKTQNIIQRLQWSVGNMKHFFAVRRSNIVSNHSIFWGKNIAHLRGMLNDL